MKHELITVENYHRPKTAAAAEKRARRLLAEVAEGVRSYIDDSAWGMSFEASCLGNPEDSLDILLDDTTTPLSRVPAWAAILVSVGAVTAEARADEHTALERAAEKLSADIQVFITLTVASQIEGQTQ